MHTLRWPIALLITMAVAIGYLDRQTLAVSIKAIEHNIIVSDSQFGLLQSIFFLAYACMYVVGGRLMDWLGTRRGFLTIMIWWSLACAAHGLATNFTGLVFGRLMLGLALGGSFPAAIKAIAEWFPVHERSTATGMINGGSSLGAVVAPPFVAVILAWLSWPWVFYLSGLLGLLCAAMWFRTYYPPKKHPRLSAAERNAIQEVFVPQPHLEGNFSWGKLFAFPQVWGMMLGKFLSDAVWFTYLAWLPKYFLEMHDFSTAQMGSLIWIPYAAASLGGFVGGWSSSRMIRHGYSLDYSRKAILGVAALIMPCMCFVTHFSASVDLAIFSIAMGAHLAFSTMGITLPADIFPRRIVGSVVGLVGFGGSMGGMSLNLLAGQLIHTLGRETGYPVMFGLCSTFHILAFFCILVCIRKIAPIELDAASLKTPVLAPSEASP